MKITVGEVRAALGGLPEETPINLAPTARHRTSEPLRFNVPILYDVDGKFLSFPSGDGIVMVPFLMKGQL